MRKINYSGESPALAAMLRKCHESQRRANAYIMPDCIGKKRKLTQDDSNWCLYYDTQWRCIQSIAKPESGCKDSYWACGLDEIRRRVLCGLIPWKNVTKYGRRVLGLNNDRRF